jgi:hypothetical protein
MTQRSWLREYRREILKTLPLGVVLPMSVFLDQWVQMTLQKIMQDGPENGD